MPEASPLNRSANPPRRRPTVRGWGLPVLSGVLIGTSYIPFPPWASLFCFVPLWWFWQRQQSLRAVFCGGLVAAFVFTLIGFNWVTYLLHEFAHLPWPVAGIGMVFYGLLAHLYVPVAGCLWFLGQRRFQWSEPRSLAILVLLTALCEANSLTLFDWNFGYPWYGAAIPVYQWAEIIGFSGLSAATILANWPLYCAWQRRTQRSGWMLLGGVALGFVLLNAGGLWLKARLPQPDRELRALLVQGNVGNSEKLAAELGKGYHAEILRRYLTLTDTGLQAAAGQHIDFALWPETAFPAILGAEFVGQELPQLLSAYLAKRKLALITGSYGYDWQQRALSNSLFALDSHGVLTTPNYSKTILLAFGEYLPGEQWFPIIRELLPPIGRFARGAGPSQLLRLGDYKIGAQICYESLFPAFTRAWADLGAQFIVNVTNDSWYGTWQEPYQHLYMTLARGVEIRRPVLRATNTGISTVSLASGEILQMSPQQQAWTGVYTVPYLQDPPTTFYQRHHWLLPTALWLALAVLLLQGGRKTYER